MGLSLAEDDEVTLMEIRIAHCHLPVKEGDVLGAQAVVGDELPVREGVKAVPFRALKDNLHVKELLVDLGRSLILVLQRILREGDRAVPAVELVAPEGTLAVLKCSLYYVSDAAAESPVTVKLPDISNMHTGLLHIGRV